MLTDKTVYRDQSLANGIYGDEKTFKGDSTEQRRSIGRNEARRGNFVSVESQLCFGDGPCVAPSAGEHHSLRTRGFQFELFRQRSWHDGQSRAGIDKELNFFDMPRRPSQMSFYVEKTHLNYLFKNKTIVANSTSNATALDGPKKGANPSDRPIEQWMRFGFVVNVKAAKQIAKQIEVRVPPNVLARANEVIREGKCKKVN